MNALEIRYKRGDLSPCGRFRFWQYQSATKKDGKRGEHWVSKHSFERKRLHTNQLQALAAAKRDWNKMLSSRRAVA